jgi:hypothetical protein
MPACAHADSIDLDVDPQPPVQPTAAAHAWTACGGQPLGAPPALYDVRARRLL